jgi:hypothetical protein
MLSPDQSEICVSTPMTVHDRDPVNVQSHLFTVRLWVEAVSDGQTEVRMQVKHVLSGEMRHFREGSAAMAFMLAKLQESESIDGF